MRQIVYVALTFVAVMLASLVIFKPDQALTPLPRQMPWFELQTADKTLFTKKDLQGSYSLVYFGFTQCPDLCPNSMSLAKEAMATLRSKGPYIKDLRVIFISVDPDRDTPKIADRYAKFFDEAFLGFSILDSQRKLLLGALDTVANNDRKSLEDTDYQVYHPTSFYLFDKKGRWAAEIKDPKDKEQLIAAITNTVMAAKESKEKI